MSTATTRTARHQRIVDLLGRHEVRSQGELIDLLAGDGIQVTQATLSRDLLDLGAVRVRSGKALVYAVPGEGGDRTARPAVDDSAALDRLRRRCSELLVSARASANLVVLRTPPGAAQFLASAFDHTEQTEVLGTIAGDDTIMVVTSGPRASARLVDRLTGWTTQTPQDDDAVRGAKETT